MPITAIIGRRIYHDKSYMSNLSYLCYVRPMGGMRKLCRGAVARALCQKPTHMKSYEMKINSECDTARQSARHALSIRTRCI